MADEQEKKEVVSDSKIPEGTPPAAPPAKVLTEETVTQLINKAVERESRRFQSDKDRGIAAAQRRVDMLEGKYAELHRKFSEVDPETATRMELESKTREFEERDRLEQQAKFDQDFHGSLKEFITGLGLDPEDSNIDWGKDASSYLEKHKKVLTSVSSLHKKRQGDMEKQLGQKLKDTEAKLRQELGLDSVDTSNAIGTNLNYKRLQAAFIEDPSPENRDRLLEAKKQRK